MATTTQKKSSKSLLSSITSKRTKTMIKTMATLFTELMANGLKTYGLYKKLKATGLYANTVLFTYHKNTLVRWGFINIVDRCVYSLNQDKLNEAKKLGINDLEEFIAYHVIQDQDNMRQLKVTKREYLKKLQPVQAKTNKPKMKTTTKLSFSKELLSSIVEPTVVETPFNKPAKKQVVVEVQAPAIEKTTKRAYKRKPKTVMRKLVDVYKALSKLFK